MSTELQVRRRDRDRARGIVPRTSDPTVDLLVMGLEVLITIAVVLAATFLLWWELEEAAGYTVSFAVRVTVGLFAFPTGLLTWVWARLWLGPPHLIVKSESEFAASVILEMALMSPQGPEVFRSNYYSDLERRAWESPLGHEEFIRRHHARLARRAYFKHEDFPDA